MKVVMVNDCAFVGETLLKYMPSCIERKHIKRTRSIWDKTFGMAYNILRADGDLYHVHYLLQDCYVASRLGKKPLIGHAHGSDLRASLRHPLWGRIVRHDLRSCNRVLVSTPDVLSTARMFREDAEYLPNPVDTGLFFPKPIEQNHEKKRVLIASDSNYVVKGTDIAIRALSKIKTEIEVSIIKNGLDFTKVLTLASRLGLPLNVLPKVSHDRLNEYYWSADIVIDRFKLGSLGLVSLEAIACGRPVVTYVSSEFEQYDNFPLKDVDTEEEITHAVEGADNELWNEEYEYLMTTHKPDMILKRLLELYESIRESV